MTRGYDPETVAGATPATRRRPPAMRASRQLVAHTTGRRSGFHKRRSRHLDRPRVDRAIPRTPAAAPKAKTSSKSAVSAMDLPMPVIRSLGG